MDVARNTSSKSLYTKVVFGALGLVVVISVAVALLRIDFSSKRINRSSLLIGEVKRGDLAITISGNGTLLPRDVEQLASEVEGRVVRINVKPGDTVTKGQVLLVLDNPKLVVAEEEAVSVREGAKAAMASFNVDLENRLLQQKSVTLQAKFAYEKARLQYDAEKLLLEEGIVSKIDHQKAELDMHQFDEIHALEKEKLERFAANMAVELSTKESLVTQSQKSLDRASNAVAALKVVSGIDGMVQEFDLQIGQRLKPGDAIGLLARQEKLYAELKIQARQAGNISKGQRVVIDTRNGTVEGLVSRVDPAVNEGTVIVDVDITGELPSGARPSLQIEGIIYQAQFKNTLYVKKPSLVKTDSVVSVYRLDSEGAYAERINAKMGKASINQIQILDGLKETDKIILSDSSDWQKHDVILLN